MVEIVGFWMMFFGGALVVGAMAPDWVTSRHLIWQIVLLFVGIFSALIGYGVWAIGNAGRYPGYPLDLILEWLK